MKDYIQDASLAVSVHGTSGPAMIQVYAGTTGRGAVAPRTSRENLGGQVVRQPGWYAFFGKRVLDVAFVFLSLPVSAMIVTFCALALWLEGGNPFYWQARLGRNGKQYKIVKLRTMVMDADARLARLLKENPDMRAEWDATQKLKQDPRITRVGGFLRRTSLDELPQLWNVLKGEMSLVGPRPMMPEQLPLYGCAKAYFSVRPGITGVWQVSDRNNSRFDYRCKLDADYARDLSFGYDLALLLRTTSVVVRRTGY
ncbi:sugar transferase [Ruegeria sp. PrR005]|uniref:Sugar transferase n=1 Tax=Ruegeria sp. PrR005 TaxID=2706882 RepID=A0A6B2NLU3_9RHOB|nr:sugar transferase [Ruegeria sp. PrR005]NDW45016.1 sugar transferase [Ruegeria sp. PrR005]